MKKNTKSGVLSPKKQRKKSENNNKSKIVLNKGKTGILPDRDEDFFNDENDKNNKKGKKIRKLAIKDEENEDDILEKSSSQRTEKNLVAKKSSRKNSKYTKQEKTARNNEKSDSLSEASIKNRDNIRTNGDIQTSTNLLENMGSKINKNFKKLKSCSSWELSEEEEEDDEEKKEANKKWYKSYYLTNLAMKLHHYQDALKYCDEMIILCDEPFTPNQVKIILAANSLYINNIRKANRGLTEILTQEKEESNLIIEIKNTNEKVIKERCEKFIKITNEYILSKELSTETRALFLKTKADYYRYLAEVTHDHDLYINKQNALHFYLEAKDLTKNLDHLNATKLDIALNYSVFLNEIMNKRINSYFIAKEAVFNALSDLKNCTEEELAAEEMRDSLMCIEILNRNVEEWYKEEMEANNEETEKRKMENKEKGNEKNDKGKNNEEQKEKEESEKKEEEAGEDIFESSKGENQSINNSEEIKE